MNAIEHNPTDILAQKRAEAARPAATQSLSSRCLANRLSTPQGRAEVFAEIVDADLFGDGPPASASDRDLWLWLGNRMHAVRMLRDAAEIAPLSVGAMWSEAMTREFEKQAGKQ